MKNFIYPSLFIVFFLAFEVDKVAGQCNEPPPAYFPCDFEPFCRLSQLGGYCLEISETLVEYNYPGFPNCHLHDPRWFSFVAGSNFTQLTVNIDTCRGGGESLQMTVYAGQPDCSANPISGITPVAGDCDCIDPGIQTLGFNTIPGYTYFLVFDGCGGAYCEITIEDVVGGNAPTAGQAEPPEELNLPDFEDGPTDTICQGATGVQLNIPQMPSATSYLIWEFPDGTTVNGPFNSPFLDIPDHYFDEEGPLEICVSATNDCDTSNQVCTEYFVKRLDPVFEQATVCEGEPFSWDNGAIDTDEPGVFNYTAIRNGTLGCPYDANLELTVISENEENPTEIEGAICFGEVYTHPSGFTTSAGADDEQHTWEGINPPACDSFFTFDIEVVGGQYVLSPPDTCNGDGSVSLETMYFPIGNFVPLDDPDLEVTYSWNVNGTPLDDSTRNFTVDQDLLEMYPSGSYQMEVIMDYPEIGSPCMFSTNPFEMQLEDYVPQFDTISGPPVICSGSSGTYEIHFQDPENMHFEDDVTTFNWTTPPGVNVIDSGMNTITIQAGENAEDGTLCVELITDCGFVDSGCIPLEINQSIIPDLGTGGSPCAYSFTFSPISADTGQWLVGDQPADATATFADVNDPATTVSVDSTGTYFFVWREGQQDCERFDTVEVDFNGYPRIENVQVECNTPPTTYTVTFDISGGTPPYELITGDGMITGSGFVSDDISSGTNFMFQIEDASGCVSNVIDGVQECNCETDAGTMADDTLSVCGDDCLTASPQSDEELDDDDVIQFALHEGSGNSLLNTVQIGDDPEFCFQTGMAFDQLYYISRIVGNETANGAVDLEDPCLSVAEGQPAIWHENPTADAGQDQAETCGMDFTLSANATVGTGSWSEVSGPGNAIFDMTTNPSTTVTVDEIGTYEFEWRENNEGCEDADTITVIFREGPSIVDGSLEIDCLPSLEYVITFVVTGGTPPYDLVSGEGMLSDTVYRDTLSGGMMYHIVIQDSEDCDPLEVTGQQNCQCTSVAGDMSDELLDTCYTACVTAEHLGMDTLDQNDATSFILHDSDDASLGNVIGVNGSGTFCYSDFSSQLNIGDTYYISFVVGNDDGSGMVDLVDPCLAVAPGQPVIFYGGPDIDAGMDDQTCGLSYENLDATQSDGSGEWTIISGPGNAVFDMATNSQTTVSVDTVGSYCFAWAGTFEGCSSEDTVCVEFLDAPSVNPSNIQFTCNDLNTEYVISFDIQGGDSTSYEVDGVPGSLDGSMFTSVPIDNGETFTIMVSDANECEVFELTDSHMCECSNTSGTMNQDTVSACPGEEITVAPAQNPIVEDEDISLYVLHEGADNQIEHQIAEDTIPAFEFDPGEMEYNRVYYISNVVGNEDSTGSIDPEDACISVSPGTPVIWYSPPVADVDGDIDEITCTDPIISLDGSLSTSVTGEGLEFVWTTDEGNITGGKNTPTADVNRPGEYSLIVTDAGSGCRDTTSVSVNVSDDAPLAIIENPKAIDCSRSEVMLNAEGSSSGSDFSLDWVSVPAGLNLDLTDSLRPLVNTAGTYILTVTKKSNGCTSTDTVNVVSDLDNPVAMAQIDSQLSCTVPSVSIDGSGSSEGENIEYNWTPTAGLQGADSLHPEVTEAGSYTLVVTDTTNGCTSETTVTVERDTSLIEGGSFTARNPNCEGQPTGMIKITDLPGGSEPITYSLNGGDITNNSGVFQGLSTGNYRVIARGTDGCRFLIDSIDLIEPEPFSVNLPSTIQIEYGDSIQLIPEISPANRPISSYQWVTDDSLNCDTCSPITVSPENTTTYDLNIVDENGCMSMARTIVTVEINRNVYIPNIFSPNDDGINDVFFLQAETGEVREVESMAIYDRWGNRVFQNKNIAPNSRESGWNGTMNGQKLNPAVFVYVIEVVYFDGVTEQIKGSITLMR